MFCNCHSASLAANISISPNQTAVSVGTDLELTWTYEEDNNTTICWHYYTRNTSVVIHSGTKLNPRLNATKFKVSNSMTSRQSVLTIRDIQLADAMVFDCQYCKRTDLSAAATVDVIGMDTVCEHCHCRQRNVDCIIEKSARLLKSK